jgi:ubiquinol-cytochrome c reductase iron-sulfur subunit
VFSALSGFATNGDVMANPAQATTAGHPGHGAGGGTRRDFLYLAAGAFGAVGTAVTVWPFISSLNPSADVLALSSTDVNLQPVAVGQAITVTWRGRPVFVRRRTQQEIDEARAVPLADLRDPQTDQSRAARPEWLILVGVCTHLGCIPLGQKPTEPRGDYGGWFCPCHGSHYDTSGRIRKGPAPRNLAVPTYAFVNDTNVRIG